MSKSQKLGRGALIAAIAMSFGSAAVAQSPPSGSTSGGVPNNSMQNPNNPQSRDGTSGAAAPNQSGSNTMRSSTQSGTTNMPKSNMRSDTMNSWQSRYATENKGRISRQAYMDEMGRRWDLMDKQSQGLTPAEVARMTGRVDVDNSGPARTGSGVAPGNMGPGNSKAQ